MFHPALLLPLLAAAPASGPITVTGHAWAPFISPMGEPFRARSATDDTLADWFNQADRNRDGLLTVDEMQADAVRFYALLDTDRDGEIGPEEVANYEWEIAPDIQVMSKTRRAPGDPKPRKPKEARSGMGSLQGAARYGLLNIPEPVAAADADFNRGISLAEFRQAALARFALLDRTNSGRLSLGQLQNIRAVQIADGRRKRSKNAADRRVGNPLPPAGD